MDGLLLQDEGWSGRNSVCERLDTRGYGYGHSRTWVGWVGWCGKRLGWVGNFLCHRMEADGRMFLTVPSKAVLAGTILLGGGRRKQPVDGWMGNDCFFFSRPSLFLYVDDGRYLYDLILLN